MTNAIAFPVNQSASGSSYAPSRGLRAHAFSLLALLLMGHFFSGSANASLLNLPFLTPDITYNNLAVNYDSGSDLLTVDSTTAFFGPVEFEGGVFWDGYDGTYDLDATITDAGILTSGTISITGLIENPATLDVISGDMLVGNLVDFGFLADNPAIMEFLVDVTSSDIGIQGEAVLLISGLDTDIDFSSDFSGTADFSDNAQIPVPTPLLLMLLGGGLMRVTRTLQNRR